MRVLMLSKALVVGQYQSKPQALALNHPVDLTVVVPPSWKDERGVLPLERRFTEGYQLVVAPLRLNGRYHLHYYPTIGSIIASVQPDIVHLDEEPYNLATFHALVEARRRAPRVRTLFFTWQNLARAYPLPFRWMERFVYRHSSMALAGNAEAARVLREKGFQGPVRLLPQFGVDPDLFRPPRAPRAENRVPVIGFAGRLVPEKGADFLLRALAGLPTQWELRVVGSGPERQALGRLAEEMGIAERVRWLPWQPSGTMVEFYQGLDLLVAPSVSRPNWTEQFGRVLVEAMACAVPVVGSSAGEIPNVIGEAGRVFREGSSRALAEAIGEMLTDAPLRARLGECGRTRVLERFTQERIADETYQAYCEIIALPLTEAQGPPLHA